MRRDDRYTVEEQMADATMAQKPNTMLTLIFAAEIGFPSFWLGNEVLEGTGSMWMAWTTGIVAFLLALFLIMTFKPVRYFFALGISIAWGAYLLNEGYTIWAMIVFPVSWWLHHHCLDSLAETGQAIPDGD